ncbi:kinase-like domain-containing protein [Mycena polygramma]|nr:kinase-like domain-containing protein [Mycena polygramma]
MPSAPEFHTVDSVDPQDDLAVDRHLWAYLVPLAMNPKVLRVDLWRISAVAKFGRDPSQNTLILPGPHISGIHAVMSWNGRSGENSQVVLKDLSSGGTWVSGELVGRGQEMELHDGDEIGFGAPIAVNDYDGLHDYRYRFCDVAGKQTVELFDDLYTFANHLGSGAGGEVELATRKKTKGLVAVKKIEYLAKNFDIINEIAVMQRVTHEHIVGIVEWRHAENRPMIFLVLEYMAGGDLSAYMIREWEQRKLWPNDPAPPEKRGIPEEICREIMYQLCHAMAHLHAHGITHRDLKPENILLRDNNDLKPYIKVCDFGLADIQTDLGTLSVMKSECGTYPFVAPEMFDRPPPGYNYLVDSFSAGVILFTLLILGSPWLTDRNLESLRNPLLRPKMAWKCLTPQLLSPAGRDLLDHLVEPNPAHRLSLTGVLSHLWMKSHTPKHHRLGGPYMSG